MEAPFKDALPLARPALSHSGPRSVSQLNAEFGGRVERGGEKDVVMEVALVLLLSICPPDWECASFEAQLKKGERFKESFGPGLTILLEPREYGWEIIVRDDRPEENIARLTPPFHIVPNPRYLEGWHFRNSDNTGPNDGSVNAPQDEREFIFSPEVGRSIDYPVTPTQAGKLSAFGRGLLVVKSMELGNLQRDERAHLERLEFEVQLSWPASWLKPPF